MKPQALTYNHSIESSASFFIFRFLVTKYRVESSEVCFATIARKFQSTFGY